MALVYKVNHHGESERLGLATELQAFANQEWVVDHMTPEQAAAAVVDRFTGLIQRELELIEVLATPVANL